MKISIVIDTTCFFPMRSFVPPPQKSLVHEPRQIGAAVSSNRWTEGSAIFDPGCVLSFLSLVGRLLCVACFSLIDLEIRADDGRFDYSFR